MGKGGGGGQLSQKQIDAQMKQQENMFNRQMALQQQYQLEAEERLRLEREREKQQEYVRRVETAQAKEATRTKQEQQEAATFREMTGQTKQEDTSDFGGGFNLDMPTIERPGYEQEDRPL
jgi:parvulin-like peptidyl-prolyl isomerase